MFKARFVAVGIGFAIFFSASPGIDPSIGAGAAVGFFGTKG